MSTCLTPYLSIIIPLYNKENTIIQTLMSVLNQSYGNYEIIIVNDGSTDSSVEKVQEIHDERVVLINQINKGISGARNTGIYAAKGDWILFLDADDTLLPNGLSNLISNIVDNYTIVAADFLIRFQDREYKYLNISKERVFESERDIYRAWGLKKLFLRMGSFIIPSHIAKKQPYNTMFSRFEDFDFLFRCFAHSKIKIIPNAVMAYQKTYAEASNPNQQNWKKDYLFYLRFVPKEFWKNYVLGECVFIALKSYPSKAKEIKNQYKAYLIYVFFAKIMYYYFLIGNGFWKICKSKLNGFIKRRNKFISE